ncbi:hypothetical protein M011DRAFT_433706 [Sporormia fimetaria CBS 119925]|uniref:Nitrate reductase n=1 Tax=Sporormia fimetaria CBS 119925 TaxID=1340428 RepID=A0A6A6UV26_9PLEO|nr:hypothetical protein M011DRAFT_433706 [Sporormia fimetaria CBS 119925]
MEHQQDPKLPPTPPESVTYDCIEKDPIQYALPPQSATPTLVLELDQGTPDSHVPRDPRLIRLTGTHPFNVEAPLTELFNEGFLTSPELFYVRNHGAVPHVRDEDVLDWEFTVEGMVRKPMKISVRQLLRDFDQVTYPVTLVCAGNRRKEQNMVRKSKGFSWGAAGLSTALFTGVPLKELIEHAVPLKGARYVCMEGADKLPNGSYGTSVKLNWVMDPNRGIMLAHKMNGEMLRPDHGKPIRVVIPGQIGGRSVKWLKRLIVTATPSDNWYHTYDNRILPTMVDPDEAAKNPAWWKDERYAIYDLSTNSAIASPAHDEIFDTQGVSKSYTVKGYAYSGGGRRITRVELSLDRGKSWKLANVGYAEDRYRAYENHELFGGRLDMSWRETCFCWCFWSLPIQISELLDAKDIVVRAMDESMNVQPRDMYWSVLGMMNNCWYRVLIHREEHRLHFEHPTQPALIPGGWMERAKKSGRDLTDGFWGEGVLSAAIPEAVAQQEEIVMTNADIDREISMEELQSHNGADEPWFVVHGQVYDGTRFLDEHPGGAQSIVSAAAMDVTDEFLGIHSETAKAMMPSYHIGFLSDHSRAALLNSAPQEDKTEPRDSFLDPRAWRKAILHSKVAISWDTRIFTFKLDHHEQQLGLPTGKHLMIRLRDPATREAIVRSYTPISQTTQKGYCDVLVKLYYDTQERAGGRMTKALDAIPIGHFVDFKGPIGKFEYLGNGYCTINTVERHIKRFYMICGGSGITPVYQVLRAIMQDKTDATSCVVLDGNRLIEDILCKEDLDRFARENVDRCKLLYTLTQGPDDWQGLRGRISSSLMKEHCMPSTARDSMILICGPESLEKSAHQILKDLGWLDEDLVFF